MTNSVEEPEWKRTLPPGYMFDPLDIEIFKYYLLPRVRGEYFHPGVISEVDVYQCQPSKLPGLDPKQEFSYFFTKTDKKHENGKRLNRFTKDQKGHWKITSKIHEVTEEDGKTIIGRKNVLVYTYENNVKTNWIMHEYMLDHYYANKNEGDNFDTISMVLCRIYERKANSDESQGRDIQQNHKRGSLSSQSNDPGESSSRPAKRSKLSMNQTSLNSPLDVQPITMMMQTTHWEEQLQQQPSDQFTSNAINACYPMDQAPLNYSLDVQENSQQPTTRMLTFPRKVESQIPRNLHIPTRQSTWEEINQRNSQAQQIGMLTYRDQVLPNLDELASNTINTYFLMDDQAQLNLSFDVQPICQQPAAMMTQNNGEEALPPLDQMASNNEDLSWDDLFV